MKRIRGLLFIVLGISLFNVLINYFFFDKGGYHLNGEYEPNQSLISMLGANFISIPLISFLLGLLIALIPFNKKTYKKRYLPTSLWIYLSIQVVFFISIVFQLINGANVSQDYTHYLSKGHKYFDAGNFENALIEYDKSLELKPNSSLTLSSKGDVYFEMEKLDSAYIYYTKAVQCDETNYNAFWHLAMVKLVKEDYNGAMQDCNYVIKNDESQFRLSNIFVTRALANINLQDTAGFNYDINKAIELNSENELAYTHRGIYFLNIGEEDKGLSDLQKAGEDGIELINQYRNNYH